MCHCQVHLIVVKKKMMFQVQKKRPGKARSGKGRKASKKDEPDYSAKTEREEEEVV